MLKKIKDFINNFASIFEETSADSIHADTVYSELEEWDSVMVLSLISMIDQEYDAVVDVDEMNETRTVEDLFNYVKSLTE